MPRGVRRTPREQAPAGLEQASVPAPAAPGSQRLGASRAVEDMHGEELQAYARKVGIKERDIQGLSEARLQQNCIAMIHEAME